jgi:hypothetical protein
MGWNFVQRSGWRLKVPARVTAEGPLRTGTGQIGGGAGDRSADHNLYGKPLAPDHVCANLRCLRSKFFLIWNLSVPACFVHECARLG